MKTAVLFLGVVLVAMANHLPTEDKIFLRNVHLACQAQPATYCDEDLLRKLAQYVDHAQVGIHMLCMAVKAGLQQQNGDFNKDVIRSKIARVVDDQSSVDGWVQKCAVKNGPAERTSVLLWLCFIQNDIPYYHKLT